MRFDDDIKNDKFLSNLYTEYEEKLLLFLNKVVKSEEVSRDLIQDIFLKLWEIRGKLDKINNINAFIYRIATNKAYDYLRLVAANRKLWDELWHNMITQTESHMDVIIKRENDCLLNEAIDSLPAQQKKIYLLNKREGLRQQQIAQQLKLSPNTVRNHLSAAFKQIERFLMKSISSFFTFFF